MTKERAGRIFQYIFLTIVSIISIFPLYWMAVSASNTSVDVSRGILTPGNAFIDNFKNLATQTALGGAFINSWKYSLILTFLALLICSLAGYGFEIFHSKGKDLVFTVLLTAMMVPFAAIMIPLFQMFSKAKLLNSTMGFILPSLSTPFLIMLFRQSSRSFPHEVLEASRLDGLSELQIFFRMYFPIMKSTYAAAMTITFMNAWNSYLWPKVIMTEKFALTMPMLVANLREGYVTDYGMLMLAVLICTIPTAIVFFVLQRNFTEGITGAIK